MSRRSERIDQIVSDLTGSRTSLDAYVLRDETYESLARRVHQHIRQCQSCDYWFEIEELDHADNCTDCGRTQ